MVAARIKRSRDLGVSPITHGGVVGQVWRGGARSATVARLLKGLSVIAIDVELGKRAGLLLGKAGVSDVIDAAVISITNNGDEILTSDPYDLELLAEASGNELKIVAV